ncbi:SVEP1-like protein, partial [Mya arenaria]
TGASADLETLLCIAYQATIGACSPGYLCSVENNLPNCRPDPTTDCGQPLGIANGQVEVLNGTLYSAKATYTCNVGFTLKGDSIRTCEPVGSWSNAEPTCRVTDCGTLTAPANGEVFAPGGTIYGRIANYNCDPGFSIIGAISVTCEKDGAWSSDPPVCRDTNGNTAVYSCKEGFDLDGAALHTCLASNIWSGDPPTCQAIDCGTLPNPAKGSVDQTEGTLYGATVTYSCVIFGYKLNGSDTRTCKLDGTWSGTELTCEQIDCGPLIAPEDGNLVLSGTLLKNTGIYSCNLGYQLQGQATLTCQESGWSHPAPICLASDCRTLPNPSNGAVDTVAGTTFGSTAQYSCNPGYSLQGHNSRTCQETGQWSNCKALADPTNGNVDQSQGTKYGQTVTYTCRAGYQIVGMGTRLCEADGQWTGSPPTCVQKYEYGLAIGLGVGLSGTIILIILGVALCMLYRRYFIHQHRPTKTKILVPTYSIPAYPETQYMEAPSLPLKMTASGATTSHYVPLGFSHNRAVTVEDNESSFSERRTLAIIENITTQLGYTIAAITENITTQLGYTIAAITENVTTQLGYTIAAITENITTQLGYTINNYSN